MNTDMDKYFRALELNPGATPSEVNLAYRHLKELYEGESIALVPIAEDTERRREDILSEIETAYRELTGYFERRAVEAHSGMRSAAGGLSDEIARVERFDGPELLRIRSMLGAQLYEMELSTKVRAIHFDSIEQERYSKLPAPVFLRGYLRLYARYLSLDPERVVSDYMVGYQQWADKEGRRERP